MIRYKPIVAGMVFVSLAWPALAASRHYSISTEQIAATVDKLGMQVTSNQVTLLTDVVAATPAPVLQVQSLERLGADRFLVRLDCETREDCLPFMVNVRVDEGSAAQIAAIVSQLSLLKGAIPGSAPRPQPESIVIRSGSKATLLLEGEHIHITIPVICLDSGAAGQKIRATDKEHRRIYTAQVIEDGLLQGRL